METDKNIPSTKLDCIQDKRVSFQHSITLTGMRVFYEIETAADMEIQCYNYRTMSTIKVKFFIFSKTTFRWNGSVRLWNEAVLLANWTGYVNSSLVLLIITCLPHLIDHLPLPLRKNRQLPENQQCCGSITHIFVMPSFWNQVVINSPWLDVILVRTCFDWFHQFSPVFTKLPSFHSSYIQFLKLQITF